MRKEEHKRENVYEQIKKEILYLELKPGATISEIEIGNRFSLSRTPVREVFKYLEVEGLLEVRPHVGTFVSLIDLNIVSDMLYMREHIEVSVLEELAPILDPLQKFKLSVQLMKQDELLKSNLDEKNLAKAFHTSDNQYHSMLFHMAKKGGIWEHVLHSSYHYERYRIFLNLTQKEELIALYREHLEMTDCLVANHITRLKELMHEHIFGSIAKASPLLKKHPSYFVGTLSSNHTFE